TSAPAQEQTEAAALFEAMAIPEVIGIMHEEGLEYGEELGAELFPDRIGEAWPEAVARIHDPDVMEQEVAARFSEMLSTVELDPLLSFFRSDLGARIIRLEIEARRALMDPAIEEAASDKLAAMQDEQAPRLALLDEFVVANDLVEANVVGSMNANFAFYTGMMEGSLDETDLTEAQILADVWAQEDDIRLDTLDWVYSYLALAYQPLDDDELAQYTAVSASPEGQALNRALFAAFDDMYATISRRLGAAAARFMTGQDI
ncbi:hypothetical protein LCGC14_2952690, partial [marine sediment metagenome]